MDIIYTSRENNWAVKGVITMTLCVNVAITRFLGF